MHVDRSRHGVGRALPVLAVALVVAACCFGAVGAGATYTGSVAGRSMSGRYKSGPQGGAWSAHRIG